MAAAALAKSPAVKAIPPASNQLVVPAPDSHSAPANAPAERPKNLSSLTRSSKNGDHVPTVAIYAYPLKGTTTKIVHFIRHGQATSNAAAGGAKAHPAYMSWDYFDARLSPVGLHEAKELREKVKHLRPEIILVSPLSRSIQTATIAFGKGKGFRYVALEELRERMGQHPCDKRRKLSELKKDFAHVDFRSIATEEDEAWKADVRETNAQIDTRIREFLAWLEERKEREIALIGHSSFFEHLFTAVLRVTDPRLAEWFENCEVRSLGLIFNGGVSVVHAPAAKL